MYNKGGKVEYFCSLWH